MKLVLFDCDGTLVDSQHQHIACMAAAYGAANRPLPERQALLTVVGLSLPQCFDHLLDQPGPGEVSTMVEAYKDAHHDQLQQANTVGPLYDGMAPLIDRLQRRSDVVLGVATGNSRRGLARVLDCHDLTGHFTVLKTADDARSKPHPDMIWQAMAETGVSKMRTVMIGDTTHDLSMAAAAEVAGIGVSYGYHDRTQLAALAPVALCDSPAGLSEALERWLSSVETA